MSIKHVTITGADDSVNTFDLVRLSHDFPFVEWGILASHNNTIEAAGTNRYPSPRWITDLQGLAETQGGLRLSLHINGHWVRRLLLGEMIVPPELFHTFARVQLNFHADKCECDSTAFTKQLNALGRDIIFQLDGEKGNDHMEAAACEEFENYFGLFDVSGGAGILPDKWPEPSESYALDDETEQFEYCGYAGGLGPDNLAEQIPLILKASAGNANTNEGRIWIDMETHVRSFGDKQFDLGKVRRCLEIASPFIT